MVYVGTYDCYKNFEINDLQSAYSNHDTAHSAGGALSPSEGDLAGWEGGGEVS